MDENGLMQNAADDIEAVKRISALLHEDVRARFSEDELFYFFDALSELSEESEHSSIPSEASTAKRLAQLAKKDGIGEFCVEDIAHVIRAYAKATGTAPSFC